MILEAAVLSYKRSRFRKRQRFLKALSFVSEPVQSTALECLGSEPVVRTNFVSQEERQSSIRFRATPVRQRRRNYSEREKRSGYAFRCAFV